MEKATVLVATYYNEKGQFKLMKRDDMHTKANFKFQLESNGYKVCRVYTEKEYEMWLYYLDNVHSNFSLTDSKVFRLFRKWLKENQ